MKFTVTFELSDDDVRQGWAPDGEGLGEAAQGVCMTVRSKIWQLQGEDGRIYGPDFIQAKYEESGS